MKEIFKKGDDLDDDGKKKEKEPAQLVSFLSLVCHTIES